MRPIRSISELSNIYIDTCRQFWYYVILVNPRDPGEAGESLLKNLNIFHLDSGGDCHYFMPGFENTGSGIFGGFQQIFRSGDTFDIPGFGRVLFSDRDFVDSYKAIQDANSIGWRYSGGCELLLFRLHAGRLDLLDDFAAYNLDDIVRNGRTIFEFIRTTINAGRDASDPVRAKQLIDEKYYEMIMPDTESVSYGQYENGWELLRRNGFQDNAYLFLSYSSKDFRIVSEIRSRLRYNGTPCWMAPYDIPQGSNYAWIIEHAIKHAGKFVLILSRSSVESVWVGKELKRAIARFQRESPEKIQAVWLNGEFSLNDTPMALPLEDIQIAGDLRNDPENYRLLTETADKKNVLLRKKLGEHEEDIDYYLAAERLTVNLREILKRFRDVIDTTPVFFHPVRHLRELCDDLEYAISRMDAEGWMNTGMFMREYAKALQIIEEIRRELR